MVKVEERKRLQHNLDDDKLITRIGYGIINEINKVVAASLNKHRDLLLQLNNNRGVADTLTGMTDSVNAIVDVLFSAGHQHIRKSAINSIINPENEVDSMNKAKKLIAVACKVYQKKSHLLAKKIFAEAMAQDDVVEAIAELDHFEEPVCGSCGTTCEYSDFFCRQCGAAIQAAQVIKTPKKVEARCFISKQAENKLTALANDIAARDHGKYRVPAKRIVAFIKKYKI